MDKVIPWLRSIVAFPLGLVAIRLFHMAGRQLTPQAYGLLDSDAERVLSIVLATIAGILGSFVVGAIARHRIWLHMIIFLTLMLVIDLGFLRGTAATQPMWFKALVLATLPLQAWIGGQLAALTFRKADRSSPVLT